MIFAEHFLREDKSFGASRKKRFPDETGESFFSLKDRKKRGLQASDRMMTAHVIFTIVSVAFLGILSRPIGEAAGENQFI